MFPFFKKISKSSNNQTNANRRFKKHTFVSTPPYQTSKDKTDFSTTHSEYLHPDDMLRVEKLKLYLGQRY